MGVRLASALRWIALAGCGVVLVLAGCGQFFPPLTSGSGGSGSNSGDYLYVGNLAADNIGGFSFTSSALTSLSGSPFAGSIAPVALAITPSNNYLYVSSGDATGVGEIYVYPINSSGTLGSGSLAGNVGPGALKADTSGDWLIGVDPFLGDAYVLQIDSSNGTVTQLTSSTVTLPNCTETSMAGLHPGLAITSDDNYVYASCGTAGIYALSFDSSSGALTYVGQLGPKNSGGADSGLAIATSGSTSYLLAAETVTNGVRVFAINSSSGNFTEVSGSPFSTGTAPDAVLVDSTDTYVYVANRSAGTISGFTLGSSGTLTSISGSPFSTGSLPVALVEDNSDTYVAAICYGGSSDLETYTIGTGGALVSFKNSATGTDPTEASSVAATN